MSDEAPIPTAKATGQKLRADAKELTLSPAQWAWLSDVMFKQGWAYARIRKEAKALHQVDITLGCLNRIWNDEQARRTASEAQLQRIRVAGAKAAEVVAEAKVNAPDLGEGVLAILAQRAFECVSDPAVESRDIVALIKPVLTARQQDIDLRRVALLEAKLKEAEDVTKAETLTPEQKQAKYKEIFGIA